MSWYEIYKATTRTSDINIDGGVFVGALFRDFEGLSIDISPSRAGTIDLGQRKVFYKNLSNWSFRGGSYQINAQADTEWNLEFSENTQATVTGGTGKDRYSLGKPAIDSPVRVRINNFNPAEDEVHVLGQWYGYNSDMQSNIALLQKNIEIIQTGTGNTARSQILIYTPGRETRSELYVDGHLGLDGIDVSKAEINDRYIVYFKAGTGGSGQSSSGGNAGGSTDTSGNTGNNTGSNTGSSNIGSTDSTNVATSYVITPSSASVNEGSVAKFTVQGSPLIQAAYLLTGVSAEDIVDGNVNGRVTFDDIGLATISIPIAADLASEGAEALTITVGKNFSSVVINDTSKTGASYSILAADGLVEEGRNATFIITSTNAQPGQIIKYQISGVAATDIVGGKLTGQVALGNDGSAVIVVPIAADKITEGEEPLTISASGISETIYLQDTSTAPARAAAFDLSAIESSVDEGGDAEFLLETDPTEAGKSFKWTITGVSAADVVGKKLSGTVVIDDDGTATITIPTATDALTEGNETITLTVNGKKATVAVLDNNTVTINSVILENDSLGSLALYKLGDGSLAIAEAGLYDGDELTDFVPLKASPSKNYVLPKNVVALVTYPEGGYGLLSKTGTVYTEQKFSDDGIAKGSAAKLSASQLLAKEAEIGADLDGDGNIGDAIVAVLDEDGDANQSDSGLFQTLSGALVIASTDLTEGDAITEGLTLMASKAKAFTLKANQTVLGIAQKDSGHWEILIQSGKAISAQTFDATTGLAKGKAAVLKTAQIDAREYYYGLDLTDDGEVSLVGQEAMPSGWSV